ncbi:MAG: putative bifunctional diguanylate cyclase/phosphodiesterase [Myxococcaceae bacterium]
MLRLAIGSAVALASTLVVSAALEFARRHGVYLDWRASPPPALHLLEGVFLIQVTVLAFRITRLMSLDGVDQRRLRIAVDASYVFSFAVGLINLFHAFLAPSVAWDGWLFVARVCTFPLLLIQGWALFQAYAFKDHQLASEREMSAQFYQQSTTDPLTGLPNRFLFNTLLTRAVARAERQSGGLAVLIVDLDRFKTINDSLGHDAGDKVLLEIAERLRTSMRATDAVCRTGGDEFLAFAEGVRTREDLSGLLQRLRTALEKPVVIGGQELVTTISVGASFYPADGTTVPALIRNADQAMHSSKSMGRNVVTFYRPDMQPLKPELLVVENELRRAIRREELFVEYQPVVDTRTQRIAWLEALVRWKHPTRGLVSPAEFIGVAEDCGLIVQIDSWVIRTACAQIARWRQEGLDLRVATNLSARNFYHDEIVETVRRALSDNGLTGRELDLEITESALLHESVEVIQRLERLQALGASIVIDDFGTGHSSLGYLNHFPIHAIKFDRALTRESVKNPRSSALVSGVIAMGQALGLRVVAEGIETDEQLSHLQKLGCHIVQGFLFSRPVGVQAIEGLLREQDRTGRMRRASA